MADRRPRRSPTRFLAPLALLLMVAVIYAVANHALNATVTTTVHHHITPVKPGRHATTAHHRARARYYVVRSGDNLSVISARTGVPLPTLQSLNPKVSSTSLQVGQRLRVR